MTYKEDGKERSVFDDTVIVFTSTNGARTPEVENWTKASAKNFQRKASTKSFVCFRALDLAGAPTSP